MHEEDYDYTQPMPYYYDGGASVNSIKKKAIKAVKARNLNVTWTVNKTSQYILIIGNDSPFHVKLEV